VPRSIPGAVLSAPDVIAARAVGFAVEGSVVAITGEQVGVVARSLCVHGDSPDAVAAARAVRDALDVAGVEVGAFV
jgi:UPF0271 protein